MKEIKRLINGNIELLVISKQDYDRRKSSLPNVVFDIYRHIDFEGPIYFISKIKPSKNSIPSDLLLEFIRTVGTDKFIIAVAGMMANYFKINDSIADATEAIIKSKKFLSSVGFTNVLFNRKMALSYTLNDVFIYSNDIGNSFISDNMGSSQSGKIISHVSILP